MNRFFIFLSCILSFSALQLSAQERLVHYADSMSVSRGEVLKISLKNTDVEIRNWADPRIVIDLDLTFSGSGDESIDRMLKRTDVEIAKKGKNVNFSIKTLPFSHKLFTRCEFRGKCTVYMPAFLDVEGSLSDGNLIVARANNLRMSLTDCEFSCGDVNSFDVFGRNSNVTMSNASKGKVKLSYGDFVAGDVNSLDVDCKYGDVTIGNSGTFYADMGYGNLVAGDLLKASLQSSHCNIKLGSVGTLFVSSIYDELKINEIQTSLDMRKASFTEVYIEHIAPRFSSVSMKMSHGDAYLNMDSDTDFYLNVQNIRYGTCEVMGMRSASYLNRGDIDTNDNVYVKYGVGGRELFFDGGGYGNLYINGNKSR